MLIAFYPGAGGNRYLKMLKGLEWKEPLRTYDRDVRNQHFKNRYLLDTAIIEQLADKDQYVLTHNVNSHYIDKHFPNKPIIFIKGDLKKCLRREWMLAGHNRYKEKKIEKVHDRLQHYASYKDDRWPTITTIEELEALPAKILDETNIDFKRVCMSNSQAPKTLQSVTDELSIKAQSSYEIIKWHLDYYQKYPEDFSKNCQAIIDIDNDDSEFAQVMRDELKLYTSEVFDEIWSVASEQS